jgi:hypothetical protein
MYIYLFTKLVAFYKSQVLVSDLGFGEKSRGKLLVAVFFCYIAGSFLALGVNTLALVAFRNLIKEDLRNLEYVWRIVLGFGAIPGIIALCFLHCLGDDDDVDNRPTWRNLINELNEDSNWKKLFAICGAWFCTDMLAYGYRADIRLADITVDDVNEQNAYDLLMLASTSDLMRIFFGSLLGTVTLFALAGRFNKLVIMLVGFIMSGILLNILKSAEHAGVTAYLAVSTIIMVNIHRTSTVIFGKNKKKQTQITIPLA